MVERGGIERCLRRPAMRVALLVLYALGGLSIAAPWIANDRPYWIRAVDLRAYDSARRRLEFTVLGMVGLSRESDEAYLARRAPGSTSTREEALAAEVEAFSRAVETLGRFLRPADSASLEAFARDVDAWRAGNGGAEGEELLRRARELRSALEREPGELLPATSYPLLRSLGGVEVGLLVAWLALLPAYLGRRRWRWRGAVTALGVATGVGTLWAWAAAGGNESHYADYKARIDAGTLVLEGVLFPPIPHGFAEQSSEVLRPPTWLSSAHVDEAGAPLSGGEPGSGGVRPEPVPVEVRFAEAPRNSPWRHPFGTDGLGRDVLVRVLYGGRVSLAVGIVSTLVLLAVGVLVGAVAGYFGGRVDLAVSRLIEVVICFPVFFLILCVVAFVGNGLWTIMLVIGLFRWTTIARLTRGEFLRVKELDFVQAARALGIPAPRIALRHVLPNAAAPLLVAGAFAVGGSILIESGLSFLGFGVNEPIPSWGSLVQASRSPEHWWIQLFPGLFIFATVACFNAIGDVVRDVLDPRVEA